MKQILVIFVTYWMASTAVACPSGGDIDNSSLIQKLNQSVGSQVTLTQSFSTLTYGVISLLDEDNQPIGTLLVGDVVRIVAKENSNLQSITTFKVEIVRSKVNRRFGYIQVPEIGCAAAG